MVNRVALVIGNSNYLNMSKLNNPKNDANDIESVFLPHYHSLSIIKI